MLTSALGVREADKLISELLSRIRIKNMVPKTRCMEEGAGELLVIVENKLDEESYLVLIT